MLERERERVRGCEREERDLDRVRPFEVHVGVELAGVAALAGDPRHPPRGEQHDHRPPDADEEPVAAGHVGQRERRELLRVFAGLVREREVDRVLRQHRDECEHGEREPLRHVELEGLRRPGQEERGTEDGEPEDHRGNDVAEADPADPRHHAGQGGERRQRERQHLTPGAPERHRSALGGRQGHPPHATGRFPGFRALRTAREREIHRGRTANELSGTGEERPKFTVLDEIHRPSLRAESRKHRDR